VLEDGSIPLPMLEEKIDRWVQARKAATQGEQP
jgi:hypothetical protein